MATTNKCKKCGCEDSFLTSPAPCPTPVGCPNPEPCSEVFNAECIVYTGANIECGDDTVVATDTSVADALNDVVTYFCENSGASYKVLTIGNISYTGSTLNSSSVLENTIGPFTITFVTPQLLRITLTNYASTGIDVSKLYLSCQQEYNMNFIFQPYLVANYLPIGAIEFATAERDGGLPFVNLTSGCLEIRIYN